MTEAPKPTVFDGHDHDGCIQDVTATVEAECAAKGLRLTPLRRRVLEILLEAHQAVGAYDVLARLQAEGFGSQPPVAYRALDFLVANGFAHKVQRLNAFVACIHPGKAHSPAFLICRTCRVVMEADLEAARAGLSTDAEAVGFRIERMVVEAEGLCPACARQDVA